MEAALNLKLDFAESNESGVQSDENGSLNPDDLQEHKKEGYRPMEGKV